MIEVDTQSVLLLKYIKFIKGMADPGCAFCHAYKQSLFHVRSPPMLIGFLNDYRKAGVAGWQS